ncbi:MAG: alpha/beta hydrolase [Sphingobium sp.]|nr:alpha/beta hydrolase [Sphingobium sp.]
MRKVLAAASLSASAWGAALAAPPPEIADQLRKIGPRIEMAKTSQIYAALLPADIYAGTSVTRDLAYGPDEKQKLDVFTPDGGKSRARPVLVFVHGGGFIGGDKHGGSSPLYDNVVAWAARHDMIGVNLNYRLAPANPWPTGGEDVGLAIDWIKRDIGRFGGDADRIFLWGHSVGATHVADYIAHAHRPPNVGGDIKGAILTSGQIYDMTGPNVSKPYYGEDEARYPAMATLPGLVRSRTPLMITSAELDPPAFKAQTAVLEAALKDAGRRPLSVELAGHSHISEIYAIGTPDTELSDAVQAFIKAGSARR